MSVAWHEYKDNVAILRVIALARGEASLPVLALRPEEDTGINSRTPTPYTETPSSSSSSSPVRPECAWIKSASKEAPFEVVASSCCYNYSYNFSRCLSSSSPLSSSLRWCWWERSANVAFVHDQQRRLPASASALASSTTSTCYQRHSASWLVHSFCAYASSSQAHLSCL